MSRMIECQNEIARRLGDIEQNQRILADAMRRITDAVNEQTADIGEVLRLVVETRELDSARAADVERRLHYVEQLCGVPAE